MTTIGTAVAPDFFHSQIQHRQSALLRKTPRKVFRVRQNKLSCKCLSVFNNRSTIRAQNFVNSTSVVSNDHHTAVSDDHDVLKDDHKVIHFYRRPLIQKNAASELLRQIQARISNHVIGIKTEQCFNVGLSAELSDEKLGILNWLLQETYEPENLRTDRKSVV